MVTEFNLVVENWIPVLYADGNWCRVGIRKALEDAHLIRQIAASNPMDNIALLRFLLAILYWCRGNPPNNMPQGRFPPEWFQILDDHKDCFNLLGEGKRFYQDKSLENKKVRPIADLLVEFPGADSVNHMRHVIHDGSYGLCPACCAMGILRLSVWASTNGSYPASVNPGSAAYAFVQVGNLFLTLKSYLTEAGIESEDVPWLSDKEPKSPCVIARLAWRPRSMWLNDPIEKSLCAYCGCKSVLITSLYNGGGWKTSKPEDSKKKFWNSDPHLLKDEEPISLPLLKTNIALHSSQFWREALCLRSEQAGKVVAIGPVVNKFTFQDAVSIDFAVTLPDTTVKKRVQFTNECSKLLYGTNSPRKKKETYKDKLERLGFLRMDSFNPDRNHPEIYSAFDFLTPNAEARIRAALNNPTDVTDDKLFLRGIYEPMVESIMASTTVGSPLRRREALHKGKAALNRAIERAIQNQAQANAADAPASTGKKKRTTRKSRQETDS